MSVRTLSALLLAAVVAACGGSEQPAPPVVPAAGETAPEATDLAAQAAEIALESIIVDTHIDVPYRLYDEWEDVTGPTDGGDYDYPRAVAGGLNAPFMSIYTPAGLAAEGKSKERADELIDLVERLVEMAPDKYAIALTPEDVVSQFASGLISLPMGMENGSPVEGDLENLTYFYDRGIRYITLAHSLSNQISDSSYDDNKAHGGLSEFGEQVVLEMNRLGIMVDVSHVSDEAFWDVMELTDVPAIASHSSARHFTPGFERNMSDDMIRQLAEEGGVIMINFGSSFISAEAHEYSTRRGDAWDEFLAERSAEPGEELRNEFNAMFEAEHGPYPYATLDQVLDHFDHVVELTGNTDHVGIGSDYDGVGDSLPIGLKDVSTYPNLVEGLLRRGYSREDIEKILGGNLLRVWSAVQQAPGVIG